MRQVRMLANKIIGSLLLFLCSNLAHAVGLTGIAVYSYLNEPLSAEIEILDLDPSLADEVTVGLASPQDFLKVNIERQTFLNDLDFEVVSVNNKLYIYVFSYENLKNPYLELLLKLKWKDGSLLKSYTLLVDPLPKNLTSQTRAHAISESIAIEQRSVDEENKINIPNLEKIKEQTLNTNDAVNEDNNTAQINDKVLMDETKNTDLTGMITLSDTSFDYLAAQTNKELETYDSTNKVSFDAEDDMERSQIKHTNAQPFNNSQQGYIIPIKDILPIEVASLKQNHDIVTPAYSIISTNLTENHMEEKFPLDIDGLMKNSMTDARNVNNSVNNEEVLLKQDHEYNNTQISEFINHPYIQQTENTEYNSQLLSFIVISVLTLLLITMLIIIYRRYKNRSYNGSDYTFDSSKHNENYNSDVLEDYNSDALDDYNSDALDEDDNFHDDIEVQSESIDRKSIDAEIATYQKQLNEIDLDFQNIENKRRVLPVIDPDYIEEAPKELQTSKIQSVETIAQSETVDQSEAIAISPKKSVPTDAFDIAASRLGNTTGIDQAFINTSKNDNGMIVEVDNIEHYDLSAYENDTKNDDDKENSDSQKAEPMTVAEMKNSEILDFPDANYQEAVVQIEPPKDDFDIIDNFSPGDEKIKLADDNQSIQSLNRYDININHNDLDDLELNLEEHNIDSDGSAAFDNFDEANIKLDLAKQYYSAGYLDSAKEVINEVVNIGNTAQKELAQDLLDRIKEIDK